MAKVRVLSQLLAWFVLANIVSCTESYTEVKFPAYANKSGEMVKIVAIEESYAMHKYEKFIANGDTLHHTAGEWEWLVSENCIGSCDRPARIELHFLGESKKCLIFEGPIKRDGIDMRSWSSYKKGNVIKYWDFGVDIEYVYTITPEHKAMAKEDYCPLDI